ncbi:MAG: hypothetical protein ACHQ2Z_03935 [Elusimicrobiota bacterium]
MKTNISEIAARMAVLEQELERELAKDLEENRRRFNYTLEKGRIAFDCGMCAVHRKLKKGWMKFIWDAPAGSLLVAAPIIYSLTLPLVLLDAWLWVYQAVCFRIYGIERVDRSRYVRLDRGHLKYLNWIEGFNCDYCGYANGLIAYAREVSSRTEQYFCPIKHAQRCVAPHARYENFTDFGDGEAYRKNWKKLREDLRSDASDAPSAQKAEGI